MPAGSTTDPLILVGRYSGVTVIPQQGVLTRLNYYDGKFLRAEDLTAEQDYFRQLVAASNRAGGPGVVNGFEVKLEGDVLRFRPGLAIDPSGMVLLHPREALIEVQELIERSQQKELAGGSASGVLGSGAFGPCEIKAADPPGVVTSGTAVYLITVSYAQALCGTEDVYGKLCEEACSTGTDRPNAVDGVVFRAVPLTDLPFPPPKAGYDTHTHLQSRLASAYFEWERRRHPDSISKEGLLSDVWCAGAGGDSLKGVPLALLARTGTNSQSIDLWAARRERMDSPPKRFWQWRMAMRPWDVFLAHVLQFQCQLHDLFAHGPATGGGG